jgi:cytochrome b pre-mRNA-processing protein 3
MWNFWKRRPKSQVQIERLYHQLTNYAFSHDLFEKYRLFDTVEGRFETLVLFAALTIERLNAEPSEGEQLSQTFVDHVFKELDRALREMGVGDTTVPKRMKKMAGSFAGRMKAYLEALENNRSGNDDRGDPLAEALWRNAYMGHEDRIEDSKKLAEYVRSVRVALFKIPNGAILEQGLDFPEPIRV